MLTYGDGVADLNIRDLLKFHKSAGRLATLTSIQLPGRFGNIETNDKGVVTKFQEKPEGVGVWINGGFFVLAPSVFDRIAGDDSVWEREPLEGLARDGQLLAHKHTGFWHPMDTLRDKRYLDDLWQSGEAPWRVWKRS